MWRNRSSCSHIKIDVCLRVPKRSPSISKSTVHKESKLNHGTKQNERAIFEQYATQKNLTPTDWYQLSSTSLDESVRDIISKRFGGSLYRALSTIYPEIEWKPWRFQHQRVPPNFWKEQSNQRKFFDDLGHTLGVKSLDDWYEKLSKKEIIKFGGAVLQPIAALMAAYPEHNWAVWKFPAVPHGFWNDKANQRQFFDWLGNELGIRNLDDWYEKLSQKLVVQHGGLSIVKYYKGSLVTAITTVYNLHNWMPWKFQQTYVPKRFWQEQANQKMFFEDLGRKLGVVQLDDWYDKLSVDAITSHGGFTLASLFNNSAVDALMAAYPEHNWIPWKFNFVPNGYWKSHENVQKFFDWLGKEIRVKFLDEWYDKLSSQLIINYGGRGLLKEYHGSAIAAIMAAFPQHTWMEWKFNNVPRSFWKDTTNQRKFLDELGKQLGIKTLDDWYQKGSQIIIDHNGRGLLGHYGDSIVALLMAVYPEHNWTPWKFIKVPKQHWKSHDNVKEFLAELSQNLSIQTLDDWYRVDKIQLDRFGSLSMVAKYKGLFNLLKDQYPDHPWDPKRFQQVGKKGQRWLAVTLKKMFPNEEVIEDYIHPKALLPSFNRPMQLDIFIPSRSLAFEYQGRQHYEEVGVFSPTKTYQRRDEEKRALCAANNINLIEVPYWWNRTQESLEEIITQSQRSQ